MTYSTRLTSPKPTAPTIAQSGLTLTHSIVTLRMREPFRISGYLFDTVPSLLVNLGDGQFVGRGEAAGVYYLNDNAAHMTAEVERVRDAVEAGLSRDTLRELLPSGGARCAIDSALWEIESLRAGVPVWKLAGLEQPRSLITTFTLGADEPAEILSRLAIFPAGTKAIKLKLDGDLAADRERVRVVREARPDVWLGVDANQGFETSELDELVAMLAQFDVALLEQPIRRGEEAALKGWRSPIPLAADESIQNLAELQELGALFDVINIKLDKCGGLTEALLMAEEARQMDLKVMVGNMGGSTLSIAPSFVVGQLCDVVDLDGPWFLPEDHLAPLLYSDGSIFVLDSIWGAG